MALVPTKSDDNDGAREQGTKEPGDPGGKVMPTGRVGGRQKRNKRFCGAAPRQTAAGWGPWRVIPDGPRRQKRRQPRKTKAMQPNRGWGGPRPSGPRPGRMRQS